MQLIVPVPAGTALFHYSTFKLSPSFFHLLPTHFVAGPFIFLIIIIVIIISSGSSKSQLDERSATLSFSPLHRLDTAGAKGPGRLANARTTRVVGVPIRRPSSLQWLWTEKWGMEVFIFFGFLTLKDEIRG